MVLIRDGVQMPAIGGTDDDVDGGDDEGRDGWDRDGVSGWDGWDGGDRME